MTVIGVDVGGHSIKAGIVTSRGTILEKEVVLTQPELGRAVVVQNIVRVANPDRFIIPPLGTPRRRHPFLPGPYPSPVPSNMHPYVVVPEGRTVLLIPFDEQPFDIFNRPAG